MQEMRQCIGCGTWNFEPCFEYCYDCMVDDIVAVRKDEDAGPEEG
jgi:hypothetical protein